MLIIILIVLGLIGGSFLSAWLHRLHTGTSVLKGRSQCPNCGHQLVWPDLIPVVSWVMLKGKCRYCQQPISWQYPALEIVLAMVLALGAIGSAALAGWPLVIYMLISILLMAVAVYDLRWMQLPDIITLLIAGVGVVNIIHNAIAAGQWWWAPVWTAFIGAVAGVIFFGLQYVISKGKWIGSGDIMLGAAIGLLLGWPGILLALLIAYLVGSVVAVILLLLKRRQWGSALAFGPFLALGAWVVVRWGGTLMTWLGW